MEDHSIMYCLGGIGSVWGCEEQVVAEPPCVLCF